MTTERQLFEDATYNEDRMTAWEVWQAARALPASSEDPAGDNFGSAEHWKEKAQAWAEECHKLRQDALRVKPSEAEALRRALWCTAADGKTVIYNIPGHPLMVRAVDFNQLFYSPLGDADALRKKLLAIVLQHVAATYHCTRVWEAWNVGTMSRDDFEPVDESDTPHELVYAILNALAERNTQATGAEQTHPQDQGATS